MKTKFFVFSLFIVMVLAMTEQAPAFELYSKDFKNGGYIPPKFTCLGEDISPELRWVNPPKDTKSFVLIVEDLDAPGGVFYHWSVYDIPSSVYELKEGTKEYLQGLNDFGNIGYGGPCPPPGKPHRYYFNLYALNISSLGLPKGATIKAVQEKIRSHILGSAFLFGLFKR
ncbi:MAG: YbhB/YbcL family Raf kinase inhibitor-like protein [Hydrogenobaculum sp.]